MRWEEKLDGLEVKVAELLVATADEADGEVDAAIPEVLRLLRERLRMDVVFVSEFVDGRRVFRHVAQDDSKPSLSEGGCDPLEASWCQRVVDGRLPEFIRDAGQYVARGQAPKLEIPVGTFISTPLVLSTGDVYGTLCCFSFGINESATHVDLKRLQYTARLAADRIERSMADSI